MRTHRTSLGFTVVELMVTLAVMAILSMLAVPSFRDMIRRNHVSAANNALLADLSYARIEAINRGQPVSLCPSSDGSSCAEGSAAWDAGWLVYTYQPGAAATNAVYAAGNILLRSGSARPDTVMRADSSEVLSFGNQGQLIPGAPRSFRTCIRAGGGGGGENLGSVPGTQLDLNGSGGVASKTLAAGADCVPG